MDDLGDDPLITDAEIGGRLRDVRRAVGMSQGDMARALGRYGVRLHQTQVSAAEKGERPLRATELVAFSRVLNVEPGRVLRSSHDHGGGASADTEAVVEDLQRHMAQISQGLALLMSGRGAPPGGGTTAEPSSDQSKSQEE